MYIAADGEKVSATETPSKDDFGSQTTVIRREKLVNADARPRLAPPGPPQVQKSHHGKETHYSKATLR